MNPDKLQALLKRCPEAKELADENERQRRAIMEAIRAWNEFPGIADMEKMRGWFSLQTKAIGGMIRLFEAKP